jgi:hypothetical protein
MKERDHQLSDVTNHFKHLTIMRKIILIAFLVSTVVFVFGQERNLGISISMAKGFLENTENNALQVRPTVSDIEFSYVKYENEKLSWRTGLGIAFHTFYSDYHNAIAAPQHLDQVIHLLIPYHLNYHPTKWFYIGAGINTNFKIQNTTFPLYYDYQIGPGVEEMQSTGRGFLVEGVINTGVQFKLDNTKIRLGGFYEMPLNSNEYFNIGLETSVLFSL